jgi:hypothetical protein
MALAGVTLERAVEVTAGPTRNDESTWVIGIAITVDRASDFVERRTHWKVVVEDSYPFGAIGVYPSTTGGITSTFPHQAPNDSSGGRPWRNGKLCLEIPLGDDGRFRARDPVGSEEGRLLWHLRRARAWVESAASGTLLRQGDPFELPARPGAGRLGEIVRIVHDETAESFHCWGGTRTIGTARLSALPGIDGTLIVAEFRAGERVVRAWCGREPGVSTRSIEGLWWLWPKPSVRPPWEAPRTWGELLQAGRAQGLQVDDAIRGFARRIRGRAEPTVLLIGFPMPKTVGGPNVEVHWDAIVLPKLGAAQGSPPPGFRANELGWWMRDRRQFDEGVALSCVATENWSAERIHARGRLPLWITSLRIAIIGIGALGSVLAELLVRAGAASVDLLDGESIVAGNICRHTATLNDIGKKKTKATALRLAALSPHVRIAELDEPLPGDAESLRELLDEYELILDCTASDEVVSLLELPWWPVPRTFVSASVGVGARRLFVYGAHGHRFPKERFQTAIEPLLKEERAKWRQAGEQYEGTGCWSPLFPARYDDIVLAAATCMKEIERLVASPPTEPSLAVFEQVQDGDCFNGFGRQGR